MRPGPGNPDEPALPLMPRPTAGAPVRSGRTSAGGLAARAVPVLLVLLTWAALGGSVRNGFVNYDDDLYLTANPHLARGPDCAGIAWAFTTTRGGNWHPVTWLSHLVDVRLFGLDPRAHHAVGLLLHTVNALLLLALLRGLTGALWPSALVAALFAVHPLHVESVAWAAERKDVLSTLFALSAALAYLRSLRRPGGRAAPAAVALLFALALMAKPMPVTLPLLLLLLDWWPLGRWAPCGVAATPASGRPGGLAPPARLLREKAPLLLLAAVGGVVTWIVQSGAGATQGGAAIPLPVRIANAALAYAGYLRKAFWPDDLAVFYPYPVAGRPLAAALALALLCALGVYALRRARRRPWLAAGLLWYLVSLLPVIGLVQAGEQAMADRYTYLPLVGIFAALAGELAAAAGRGRRAAALVAGGALLALGALSAAAASQVGVWRDSVTLFTRAIAVTQGNYIAHNNLGAALLRAGAAAAALPHFEATIRLAPDSPRGHLNLGRALAQLGRHAEAIGPFLAAVERDREDPLARRHLARSLEKLGRRDEAVAAYREALRLEPRDPEALDDLGVALARAGALEEAIPLLEAAAALAPGDPSIAAHLAVARNQRAARPVRP